MDFRTFCDNKDCRKEMRPVADKDTFVAYCSECGKPVNSISIFMRRQMVAQGQIKRNENKRLPWAVKCLKCTKEGPPDLNAQEKLVCSFCNAELDYLARPFAVTIKEHIKTVRRSNGE